MIVGVPKEIKTDEYRVSMTPAGVHDLVTRGHKVLLEDLAIKGSGITNQDYLEQEWLKNLKNTYKVDINEKVFNKMVKR